VGVVNAVGDTDVVAVEVHDGNSADSQGLHELALGEAGSAADLQTVAPKEPNHLMHRRARVGAGLQLGLQQPVRSRDAEVAEY